MKEGVNLVNYDAPLAMYFYGSPYSDPADPIVAATVAMYAGESLAWVPVCWEVCIHSFKMGKERKNSENGTVLNTPAGKGFLSYLDILM